MPGQLRVRRAVILALVGGMAVLSVGAASASTARPAASSSPLTFITSGMSCVKGVCALGSGNVGASYGQNIAISGGSCGSPCSLPVFSVVTGKLPPGLSMPSAFGCCGDAIGGTPTRKGTFTFTIQVRDGAGDVASQAFSIEILRAAALAITFPATCCNDGTVGTSYLQNFFVSGGVGPYTASVTAGQLPPGLSLSASPPISISGTPTTRGTFTFTVTVTDSKGAQATKSGSITVS
jgi:large repetitive protein